MKSIIFSTKSPKFFPRRRFLKKKMNFNWQKTENMEIQKIECIITKGILSMSNILIYYIEYNRKYNSNWNNIINNNILTKVR